MNAGFEMQVNIDHADYIVQWSMAQINESNGTLSLRHTIFGIAPQIFKILWFVFSIVRQLQRRFQMEICSNWSSETEVWNKKNNNTETIFRTHLWCYWQSSANALKPYRKIVYFFFGLFVFQHHFFSVALNVSIL